MSKDILCPQHEIKRLHPLGQRSSTGEGSFVNTQDLKPNNPDVDTNEMGDVPEQPFHRK